ncbi:MAG: BatD family protein [Phycisphaerales bacterium]|jgi:hypothetical protein|nr:BatD family protein [Phycisphaerales bacterium]
MKHLNKFIQSIFLLMVCIATPAFAQEVYIDIRQNVGYVGVPIQLTVVFENIESDTEPTIPDIEGFTIQRKLGEETSSQTTFINGKITSTSTRRITFLLTPKREGTLVIPALTFFAGGKAFKSSPRQIEIEKPPTGGALKAEVTGTQGDIYLGRPIDLTLRIFIEQFTDPILGIELDAKDMFSFINSNSDFGIFTEVLQNGNVSLQKVQGKTDEGISTTFYVYSAQATAWPETTGELQLRPITILVDYPISLSRQRRTGIFGSNSLVVNQSQLISTQAEIAPIEVLTTPTKDRPPWFSGAVGNFDFRLVAEPNHVKVGEPITLTMRVTDLTAGQVNLDYLSAPLLDRVPALTDKFKVPDKPLGGTVEGRTKIFTQTIRPRNSSTKEIPSIPLTSFDPESGKYETVWTKAIPITVESVETLSADDFIGSSNKTTDPNNPIEVEGGILANYAGNDLLESENVSMTPTVLIILAIPPSSFAILLLIILFRKHSRTPSFIRKSETKHAMRSIKNAACLEPNQQAVQLSKALRMLKTDCNDNNFSKQMEELLTRCEASRFGGYSDESLVKDACQLLEQIK